jgi:hypothetical protein
MLPTNVRITSARYANAQHTIVFVFLSDGQTWQVVPNNGSGQANVLSQWQLSGGNIGPFVPPVPGGTVPIGSLIWLSSPFVPQGHLLCDGQAVKRLQYAKLFAVIGTTFGAGDLTTTFNLPDLREKMVRGWAPVNSLDPEREFGSDQESQIGLHRHGVVDPGHTHEVIDPGHLHPVNDPGHTHVGDDPGHTHPPGADPGHSHGIKMYESNLAFPALQSGTAPVVLCPFYTYLETPGGIPNFGSYSPVTDIASAKLTVNQGSANLLTAVGEANVSDELDPTFITVNPATTNISQTDSQGGPFTKPANLTLLPFIRY